MKYKGRIGSIGIVIIFNIIRYFYYHQYLALPFKGNFFILTAFFMIVAWGCGFLYDRAQFYSTIDPLTNTYNRRMIEQSFQKLVKNSTRTRNKFGVIMIDLDNFKQVNDTYGHLKGDELLIQIAAILTKLAKKDDLVGRWGGDEFLILTPNIDTIYKTDFRCKLEKELSNHHIFNYPSFGVSFGIAVFPDQGKDLDTLIRQADTEMYNMKRLNHS